MLGDQSLFHFLSTVWGSSEIRNPYIESKTWDEKDLTHCMYMTPPLFSFFGENQMGDTCLVYAGVQLLNAIEGSGSTCRVIILQKDTYEIKQELSINRPIVIMGSSSGSSSFPFLDGRAGAERVFRVKPGGYLELRYEITPCGSSSSSSSSSSSGGDCGGWSWFPSIHDFRYSIP